MSRSDANNVGLTTHTHLERGYGDTHNIHLKKQIEHCPTCGKPTELKDVGGQEVHCPLHGRIVFHP